MAKRGGFGYQRDENAYARYEDSNSLLIDDLKDKVCGLKSLALDMGDEIKYQNNFLRDMDHDFEKSTGFLGNSMRRVQKIALSGNHRHLLYLALFALVIFFLVYALIRFR